MFNVNKYLLINTDGYDINYRTFNSFEEAATEMEKAYKAHKPDYLEEKYADLTYIDENNAAVYCNGEDIYLWEIITVEFNLSEDDRDNIYRQIWQKNVLEDVKSYAVSEGVELSEEQASKVANLYISGRYDCSEGYWTNIQTLINEVTERA